MNHWLLTALLLFAALILYAVGLATGSAILFTAGCMSEMWFWVRTMRSLRTRKLEKVALR